MTTKHTLDQQLQCVHREIEMRRRVYPAWVRNGRMKEDKADYEIACMESVYETVRSLRQRQSMTSSLTGKPIE